MILNCAVGRRRGASQGPTCFPRKPLLATSSYTNRIRSFSCLVKLSLSLSLMKPHGVFFSVTGVGPASATLPNGVKRSRMDSVLRTPLLQRRREQRRSQGASCGNALVRSVQHGVQPLPPPNMGRAVPEFPVELRDHPDGVGFLVFQRNMENMPFNAKQQATGGRKLFIHR